MYVQNDGSKAVAKSDTLKRTKAGGTPDKEQRGVKIIRDECPFTLG